MATNDVRVRFAVSPINPLDASTMRVLLYNYLYAKKRQGTFLLQIADSGTQQDWAKQIFRIHEALKWCELEIDEGEGYGGEQGPYRQSQRKALYGRYLKQLLDEGKASMVASCPIKPTDQPARNVDSTEQKATPADPAALAMCTVRLNLPEESSLPYRDILLGDQAIARPQDLDLVLYNAATDQYAQPFMAAIDDYLMGVTHVFRESEAYPSLFLKLAVYKLLGWCDAVPQYAFLPPVTVEYPEQPPRDDAPPIEWPLGPINSEDTSLRIHLGYREAGFFQKAYLSFMVAPASGPSADLRPMGLEELCEHFDLSRPLAQPLTLRYELARELNHACIMAATPQSLARYMAEQLHQRGLIPVNAQVVKAVELVRAEVYELREFWSKSDYLWVPPTEYDLKARRQCDDPQTPLLLRSLAEGIHKLTEVSEESVHGAIVQVLDDYVWPRTKAMDSLRLALVGALRGVAVEAIIAFIGIEDAYKRIRRRIVGLG